MNRLEKILTRLLPNLMQRTFAAGKTNRLSADWSIGWGSINSDLRIGLKAVRNRARDLVQNDPYAKKFLNMLAKNVVGPDGFTYRASVLNDDFKTVDSLANAKIENGWIDWQNKKNCTVTGNLSFREVNKLVIKTIARDGEIFIRTIKNTNFAFGFTLQLIEPDLVDEQLNFIASNGNPVVMGIEIDTNRKPIAYYVRKATPETDVYGIYQTGNYERVPANEMKHLFVQEWIGQLRGYSWFAPVAIRLKMLQAYEEAALVAARIAASKTLLLESKDTGNNEINVANVPGGQVNSKNQIVQSIEPGSPYIVPDGYTSKDYNPSAPNDKQADFTEHNLRGVASGFDVSFIALANNYSQVNYTSSRTNLLDERDTWKDLHSWMREHWLDDVKDDWLAMALLTQTVVLPLSKYEKFRKGYFYSRVWDWVDPKNEMEAKATGMDNLIITLEDICAERGIPLEEHIKQLAYEKGLLAQNGLQRITKTNQTNAPVAEDPSAVPSNGKAKKKSANIINEN